MLSLTRRLYQTLQISDDIRVKVLRINGDEIRLGIEAPDEVVILREELTWRGGKKTPAKVTKASPAAPPQVRYKRRRKPGG